jgi:hypothetical protein
MAYYYKGKKTFSEHLKQIFWHFVYPFFPTLRDGLIRLKLIHHNGRQPFYLGHLAPNFTIEHFRSHLLKHGFHNHFVAWYDDGQVLSLRKHDSFRFQHHLRLFEDGEIRGHYEFTPEGHPIKHFLEEGMVPAKKDFKSYLGAMLVEDTSGYIKSHNLPEASTGSPYNGK